MTTSTSFKAYWLKRFEENKSYYFQDFDPFEKWERSDRPEILIDWNLITSLRLLYVDQRNLADRFLSAVIVVVDRAITEDKFRLGRAAGSFPMNRGECLRARAYATTLKIGTLPINDVTQASLDYEEWCQGYSSSEWDSQAQANYLSSVRLALIANDVERASALLKTKKRFKWHATEYALWVRLVGTQLKDPPVRLPLSDSELQNDLQKFFEDVRNPDYKPGVYLETEIVRFEVGVILFKYFLSDGRIDWPKVIALISA